MRRWGASAVVLAGMMISGAQAARAQTVTPVPKLDLNRYTGVWYEITRFPPKAEKKCLNDGMVLYALGEKPGHLQMSTTCQLENGSPDSWGNTGKMDKAGDGRLKLGRFWPFTHKYWVLAAGTGYEWALVGTPNHKSLWVLSRTRTLSSDVLSSIEAQARAQGFNTDKLVPMPQQGEEIRSVLTTNGSE